MQPISGQDTTRDWHVSSRGGVWPSRGCLGRRSCRNLGERQDIDSADEAIQGTTQVRGGVAWGSSVNSDRWEMAVRGVESTPWLSWSDWRGREIAGVRQKRGRNRPASTSRAETASPTSAVSRAVVVSRLQKGLRLLGVWGRPSSVLYGSTAGRTTASIDGPKTRSQGYLLLGLNRLDQRTPSRAVYLLPTGMASIPENGRRDLLFSGQNREPRSSQCRIPSASGRDSPASGRVVFVGVGMLVLDVADWVWAGDGP